MSFTISAFVTPTSPAVHAFTVGAQPLRFCGTRRRRPQQPHQQPQPQPQTHPYHVTSTSMLNKSSLRSPFHNEDGSSRIPFHCFLQNIRRTCLPLLFSLCIVPLSASMPAFAASKKGSGVITMTDQVPNFTLPSQEQRLSPKKNSVIITTALRVARVALPTTAVLIFATWMIQNMLKRAQEKQLRDFQAQLSSFSSMLELDGAATTAGKSSSDAYSEYMNNSKNGKNKKRSRNNTDTSSKMDRNSEVESKLQLDLFSSSPPTSTTTKNGKTDTAAAVEDLNAMANSMFPDLANNSNLVQQKLNMNDVTHQNDKRVEDTPFETAVVTAVHEAMASSTLVSTSSNNNNTAKTLSKLREPFCNDLSMSEAEKIAVDVASRLLSVRVDDVIELSAAAAAAISSKDEQQEQQQTMLMMEIPKLLQCISVLFEALKQVSIPTDNLSYSNINNVNDTILEDVFRQYAIFILTSTATATSDATTTSPNNKPQNSYLMDIQQFLRIPEQKAKDINAEIAKGMFQVVASAAMADGALSEEDRNALSAVKKHLAPMLDGPQADSILSEVAAMRAMYAMQPENSGDDKRNNETVSDDEIEQLRLMCKQLGVDMDEVLQNADALTEILGPDAKQMVEEMKTMLANSGGGKTATDTSEAVDVDAEDVGVKKDSSNVSESGKNVEIDVESKKVD